MDYQKVIEQARTCIGPYCKACAVCNGRACKNTMPGPGAKGIGDVAIRNFQNGRRSVSIWIRSVKRNRLIRQ